MAESVKNMRKLFNGENLFFRTMGRLGDFMCLNFLFLLTSLPLVTAGASVCALYGVLDGIRQGEEGGCGRRYIRALKKYFCRGTAYWMICLAAALFLVLGIWGAGLMEGGGRVFFPVFSITLASLWAGMMSFGLILISWADFSVRRAFRSAVLITVGSFPWLVLNIVITCVPVLLIMAESRIVMAYGMPLFALFGIPFLGYVKTYVYRQALKKYGLLKEEQGHDYGETTHLSDRGMDGNGEGI